MSSIMPLWVPDVNGTYKIVFTKTAIPSDKISSATIVSTEDSDIKIYMYKFDENGVFSIYISPEIDGATIYANEDCSYMFNCDLDIRSINFSNFNTINTTNMRYMFYNCKLLTSLDLSSFDTSNVTDMGYMFSDCYNIQTGKIEAGNAIFMDDLYLYVY